ncbi:MAG TPA: type II toxin-antitoxin system RelE/ParE family toxin [Tepidisphaeraceae bacterium]|jgi:toxin ParE1/3/4
MPTLYRVIVLPEAFADLDRIIDYIKRDSPQNAMLVVERLQKAIESLDELPHRHKIHRWDRRPERVIRSVPVSSYIIYYRVIDTPPTVRVLTIRHGARRPPRRFSDLSQ